MVYSEYNLIRVYVTIELIFISNAMFLLGPCRLIFGFFGTEKLLIFLAQSDSTNTQEEALIQVLRISSPKYEVSDAVLAIASGVKLDSSSIQYLWLTTTDHEQIDRQLTLMLAVSLWRSVDLVLVLHDWTIK